jgi:hypothetical protein
MPGITSGVRFRVARPGSVACSGLISSGLAFIPVPSVRHFATSEAGEDCIKEIEEMVTTTSSAIRLRRTAALAVVLGFWATAATADQITFTLSPQAGDGRITFAGGSTPLTGTSLGVSNVTGLGTPTHGGGALSLDTGQLTFNTGNFTGASLGGKEWDFASGGNLLVTGGIASLGIAPGSALLTGTFSNGTAVRSLDPTDLKVQGSAFFSVVNPTLAAYFGLPTGGSILNGGLSTMFAAAGTAPAGFSSSGFSSGTVTTEPVPEPGMLVVFGVLAAGGVAITQRRRSRVGA